MDTTYIIGSTIVYKPAMHLLCSLKSDESIALAVSASLCLSLLLEKQGQILLRNELLDKVWGARGMNVTPNTLYQNISLLRKSLNQLGVGKSVIQTIPRRGFSFSSEIVVERVRNEAEDLYQNPEDSASKPFSQRISPVAANAETCNTVTYKYTLPGSSLGVWKYSLMLIIVALIVLVSTYQKNDDTFSSYQMFMTIDECKFYRNMLSSTTDEYYISFIERHNISCADKKFIYITNFHPSQRTSIIACQNPVRSGRRLHCTSSYYFK